MPLISGSYSQYSCESCLCSIEHKFQKTKNLQAKMSAFASNFKNLQHKSTIPVRPEKQRKCTSRSFIPFKEQLIWVHMDQTAFKILSTPGFACLIPKTRLCTGTMPHGPPRPPQAPPEPIPGPSRLCLASEVCSAHRAEYPRVREFACSRAPPRAPTWPGVSS